MFSIVKPRTPDQRGFTLIELLIVVVIIGVLTAIAVPAYISVVGNSQDSAAKQELASVRSAEQIHQATQNSFVPDAQLTSLKLLEVPSNVRVATDTDGTCFAAMAFSDSGKLFWIDSWNLNPREYSAGDTSSCAPFSDTTTLDDLADDLGSGAGGPSAPPADASADFTWQIVGGEAHVTDYSVSASKDAVIPATYTTGGVTYDVTTIGSYSFRFKALTSLTIPASVTLIKGSAVYGNSNLTKIYMEGNAPSASTNSFHTAAGKRIYYRAGATGFTNPWYGYATATY